MVPDFLLRTPDTETVQVMDDLVREALRILLPVTAVLMWSWTGAMLLLASPQAVLAGLAFVLTLGLAWATHELGRKHLGMAVTLYLCGLSAVVTIIASASTGVAALYLYIMVVLVAATLADPGRMWAATLVCLILELAVARNNPVMQPVDVALPAVLLLLTALTAWLGSHRLYTTLGWALGMTREAQENAQTARQHRAEVRRVLKSLDEAYARLERANEALIFAQEAAERAYRFKADFVANVSHELRTPLNLIVGFSEMMATAPESYGRARLPKAYRGDVMAIYRSARHLGDLINDVLDLSQIEAGRLPLLKEPTDSGEVIHEAIDIVRGLAEAKGLRLETDLAADLPVMYLDRTRVRQVLLNLLANATRFTDAGFIRVRAHLEGQETVVLVEDSGSGIPPQQLARAFEAFEQLHEDRPREGSGLGLAISKRFIELHGGRMWIESQTGRGTVVGFSLPHLRGEANLQEPAVPSSRPVPKPQGRPLILVLHDDPQILSLLQRHVAGFEFVLADSAPRACEIIREMRPVAAIVAHQFVDLWATLAPQACLPAHLPMVACSLPSTRTLSRHLGAAGYLAKPVTREGLEDALLHLSPPPQSALVIDDNPHVVRLLARMLQVWNPSMVLLEAFGGVEGLRLARTHRPDLILLDLQMPDIDGYAFLREIGDDKALAESKVIIVSAHPLEQKGAPVMGELRLTRVAGFSVTELLEMLQGLLSAIAQPGAVSPTSAAALAEDHPDGPAW